MLAVRQPFDGDGAYVSETVMAPRVGSNAADDGSPLTFGGEVNQDWTDCWIFDAADPAASPVARVRLPERIPSGSHATYPPLVDL